MKDINQCSLNQCLYPDLVSCEGCIFKITIPIEPVKPLPDPDRLTDQERDRLLLNMAAALIDVSEAVKILAGGIARLSDLLVSAAATGGEEGNA